MPGTSLLVQILTFERKGRINTPDFAQSTTRSRLLAIDRLLLGPQRCGAPVIGVQVTCAGVR
jgi:hypothetical protein